MLHYAMGMLNPFCRMIAVSRFEGQAMTPPRFPERDADELLVEEDWLPLYSVAPDVIRLYCEQTGLLLDSIKAAIDLAADAFPSPLKTMISLMEDPEEGSESVVVSLALECGVEEAVAAYDDFVARWVAQTPWDQRKSICLSYRLA